MNKRIQKLMSEANLFCRTDGTVTLFGETYAGQAEVQKFAELIVRECMSVAKGMRNPPNLNYKPSDRLIDELRLHFGVEE